MIPRLHPQDVRSGFSDKVFLMILTLDNITDKHLRFFLFEWPQKIPKPFTTGQVKIIEVAKRARDPKIYQRFFDLGLKVTDDQLTSIVHKITNECTDVLEVILNKTRGKGVPATMQAFLNMRIKDTAKQLDSRLILDSKCDNWIARFRLAIDFVRELARLHSASDGPVVLCNSQSLDQTLKQFGITENWELFLVGFDNLQQRKGNSLVKCSDNELRGTFIAPEQLWPYAGTKVFNIEQQPGYTEASDIWKIPDVTETLLGTSKKAQNVFDYLSLIHYICKSSDPQSRPSAAEVLKHYEEVWSVLVN